MFPTDGSMIAAAFSLSLCLGSAAVAKPKHFVVALVDDLGGYNVPWRNPENTIADDLLQLSTKEGMTLENFYTFKSVCMCVSGGGGLVRIADY